MKKLVKEYLNEREYIPGHADEDVPQSAPYRTPKGHDYSRLEKQDKLDRLEPLATSIKGVLSVPEWFDTEFIDQITDMWFVVNKEIEKNS